MKEIAKFIKFMNSIKSQKEREELMKGLSKEELTILTSVLEQVTENKI